MTTTFSVVEPTANETPLIVEVPHAGLAVDAQALASLAAPAYALGRDADLYVDALYADAPSRGATLLVAHMSRYVVDLNRSEADVDPEAVEGASSRVRATRGIVWRLTSEGGRVLVAPLSRREFERRLTTHYRPYHLALTRLIEHKRARFGFAIVLAAHSMPSTGRAQATFGTTSVRRADVVPGTRGKTSADLAFIDVVERHARAAEMSVVHDDPYQGGFTTAHYGRPTEGVHVVQVELARRLYMNERTLEKHDGFDRLEAWCSDLTAILGATRPRQG